MTHSLSRQALTCIEDETNYLCMNNQTRCATSLEQCPSTFACIGSHLVQASSEMRCYASRVEFPRSFLQESESIRTQCYLSNMYRCHSTGQCSEKPCSEWMNCLDGHHKCWDGTCVSEEKLCRNRDSGCPAYSPISCSYTGRCVADKAECESIETVQPLVKKLCQSQFGLPEACPFDGSCATSLAKCQNGPQQQCLNQYPNSPLFLQ